MPKKIFSGREAVRILTKEFGFSVVSQKGSHIKLRKVFAPRNIMTIVPLHKELARGTLKGILDLAEINFDDFLKKA